MVLTHLSAGSRPRGVLVDCQKPAHSLLAIPDPDDVKPILVDRTTIPEGEYSDVGYETRQVFDIIIKRVVTEWRAQILTDSKGKRYVAPFPDGVLPRGQHRHQDGRCSQPFAG